ncbi:MAG: T9SS type A sorting domain-containing protein [candidate division Zixibacteria bacterium]|nr:T9SS type A sorting domain-containing protein [candidate division Zixibacteria bacterium]
MLILTPYCLAQSPGEIVGTTFIDNLYFNTGTNRIAQDTEGGLHVCWTKKTDLDSLSVFYNYRSPEGDWQYSNEGNRISVVDGAWCCNLDLGPDDCLTVFYQRGSFLLNSEYNNLGEQWITWGWDSGWPKGAHNQSSGRFHLLFFDYWNTDQIYGSSSDGLSWPDWQSTNSQFNNFWAISTSNISQRTAIILSISDNLAYNLSEDGITWDFENSIRITDIDTSDNQTLEMAYSDLLFDNDDNLNIVFNTYSTPYPATSTLWHWSEESNEITQIAQFGPFISGRPLVGPNLGVDSDNNLFCVWTGFNPEDESSGFNPNGDLYMSYSADGGGSWSDYQNITNSQTPGCLPGDCDSDDYSSLAETVDEHLHILYINDKYAGFTPPSTENQMLYLAVPNPLYVGITETESLPVSMKVLSNFPNPFNAQTTISFSLEHQSAVNISIYDITGRLVEMLTSNTYEAGSHSLTWNATEHPSGIYFARLAADKFVNASRMVLLK